jgi:hypothetical protein
MEASTDEQKLITHALLSYADACTRPKLTPNCPYYRQTDSGPTCGEECRPISVRHGAPERPVGTTRIGGLVLSGRKLPKETVAGMSEYDAKQRFIEERECQPTDQSTGTLLIGLDAALRQSIIADPGRRNRVMELWQALAIRDLDVESVVKGAILPNVAMSIGMIAATPAIIQSSVSAVKMSTDLRERILATSGTGWPALLDSAEGDLPSLGEMFTPFQNRPYLPLIRLVRRDSPPLEGSSIVSSDVHELLTDPRLRVATSQSFMGRIEEWLVRLLHESLDQLIRADAPPQAVFAALPETTPTEDVGTWIYERLTITRPEEWATPTLLLEWRSLEGEDFPSLPARIAAERTVDRQQVAELALNRMSRRHVRQAPPRDLGADSFVQPAMRLLASQEYSRAAAIFEGLLKLRPGDSEVLNNLGFCLLPVNKSAALLRLQEATLFEVQNSNVNSANRALALHLLGRDTDALEVIGLTLNNSGADSAYLWRHDGTSCDGALRNPTSGSIREYLTNLTTHIRANQIDD